MSQKALFDFIKKSPTAYHAVDVIKTGLELIGYEELFEGENTTLEDGRGYFTIRNGSSLIAFRYRSGANGFMIAATHSDSPAFKVKEAAESVAAYARLEVEKYGGMIHYTWLDRPLSVAGRVLISTPDGLEARLVDFDRDLLTIPSLAIHLNRTVNDGAKFNPAQDLLPLYSVSKDKSAFMSELAELAGAERENIVSHDLFVYNRDEGREFGKDGEFILAPRLDDLACVYASAIAFTNSKDSASIPVIAIFDNEEVGSSTKQGAASTFLYDTLMRISGSGEEYLRQIANSFMVSADNAHAVHPAHPELADPDHAPVLGSGIAIKYSASQSYATDGLSDSVFRTICRRAGVPVQSYCNRADQRGGSTLGSISDTVVSVPTVDIGIPQLAMHSANETAAGSDVDAMINALTAFFETSIVKKGNTVKF